MLVNIEWGNQMTLTKLLEKIHKYTIGKVPIRTGRDRRIKFRNIKYFLADIFQYCYENNAKVSIITQEYAYTNKMQYHTIKFSMKTHDIIITDNTTYRMFIYNRNRDMYRCFYITDVSYTKYRNGLQVSDIIKQLPENINQELKCWLMLNGVIEK